MFEIDIEKSFSAAHQLKNYPGDCARLHGHNWNVHVYVRTGELDSIGIAVDFKKLKRDVQEVLDVLDHQNLSELSIFSNCNPTSEYLAKYIYETIGKKINTASIKVSKVRVCESAVSGASYFEN